MQSAYGDAERVISPSFTHFYPALRSAVRTLAYVAFLYPSTCYPVINCDHRTLIRIAGGGLRVRDRLWKKVHIYELISAFTPPKPWSRPIPHNFGQYGVPSTGFCAIDSGFDTRKIILCACSSNANLGSMPLSLRSLSLSSGNLMGGPARHGPVQIVHPRKSSDSTAHVSHWVG